MTTDLSSIPAIDAHCHPWPIDQVEITSQQLRDAISEELTDPVPAENQTMLLARMVVRKLAKLLGCAPDWDTVLAARNEAARADIMSYHRRLFDDAKIGLLLVDPGYPVDPFIPTEQFSTIVPCPVLEGYRIERFAPRNAVLGKGYSSFDNFADAFKATLDSEADKPNTRFYKSVIAYYTGLAIERVSDQDAQDAWNASDGTDSTFSKTIRDWMIRVTALKSLEHDLPFQIHTGHTSKSNPWPNVNPILLTPMLNQPELRGLKLVLVHGGYPFCTEAGYLTSVYPNVALDLSLMIPWSSIGIRQRIEQTLESAPTAKVMYGSDGIHIPELFWISAINARRALGQVLDRLIDEDVLDAQEAIEVGKDILYRNAERIYGVSLDLS